MQLQLANRKRAKMKLAIQGPSGSGKTYSSLLVALGLSSDWSKIAVIDTENHSAELYSHLGGYNVLSLSAPFTPESYTEAISICEKAGMEVIIIDSVSPEWEYLLSYHSSLPGNSFMNFSKVTTRHNEFLHKMLHSQCHIIATMRTKQDYVVNDRNGKLVPEKVGLKTIQRDSIEYEFTLAFTLDMKNLATASKDRTGLFFGKPGQILTAETGEQILSWCNAGTELTPKDVSQRIGESRTIQELLSLYQQYPQFKNALKPEFEQQKRKILVENNTSNPKILLNGIES
jgi:hypothetical protein